MTLPTLSLEGKVAVITGGSKGIGKAVALTFAEAGANVAICARNMPPLEEVAGQIRSLGRRCLAVEADIGVKSDIDKLFHKTLEEFGTIDILLNNAYKTIRSPLVQLREDGWDKMIDINLKGYFLCSQAAARVMMEKRSGSIISMVSEAAVKAAPELGSYSIAKAGVVMLTKALAVELGRYNIRANAIGPGAVNTELNRMLWSKNPESHAQAVAMVPLGRIAEESDIAAAALFLASDASSHISGQTIYVEGGLLA